MSDELREANMKVVRDYVEAMNEWDFDRMGPLLSDDFIFEMLFPAPGLPTRIDGRQAMIAFQRPFAEIVKTENMHDIQLDTLHSDPAEVILFCKSDFVFHDPSREYRNDYISRFTVRDGKIARFQENYDSVRLVQYFGGVVESPFETEAPAQG
jgi:ketosteroid isomerase-like protein